MPADEHRARGPGSSRRASGTARPCRIRSRDHHPEERDRPVHHLAEPVPVVRPVEVRPEAEPDDDRDRRREVDDRVDGPAARVAAADAAARRPVRLSRHGDSLRRHVLHGVERRPDEDPDDDDRHPDMPVLEVADRAGDGRPFDRLAADRRPELGDRDHDAHRAPDGVAPHLAACRHGTNATTFVDGSPQPVHARLDPGHTAQMDLRLRDVLATMADDLVSGARRGRVRDLPRHRRCPDPRRGVCARRGRASAGAGLPRVRLSADRRGSPARRSRARSRSTTPISTQPRRSSCASTASAPS